jgi:hypothetical protein
LAAVSLPGFLPSIGISISFWPAAAPDAPLPAEYWDSLLKDPRAQTDGAQMRRRRLAEIQRHVLRVSCRRCERTVEIQTVDAIRLSGGKRRMEAGRAAAAGRHVPATDRQVRRRRVLAKF